MQTAKGSMTPKEVRDWIGKYFLFTLAALGGYIYIFSETVFLPIARSEALAAGETIIPVFLGQLTIMYRWFFSTKPIDTVGDIEIPSWLIKGPPFLSIVLIVASIVSMIVGNRLQAHWSPDPETFRRIVVFVVSLLNVTTLIVISRYFGDAPKSEETRIRQDGQPTG
jgi:hypothetical protein